MMDILLSIDTALFYFINHGLQNTPCDIIMPVLTDLNKSRIVLVGVGVLWVLLLTKGGRNGRIAALLLIPTIIFSDQLNSSYVKFLFERMRPCHTLEDVHLLVSCGSGYSFPSSHAVNNFAGAFVLAFYIRRWQWAFWSFASVVAFSRVYVGVHYPSDIVAGAVLGMLCGLIVVLVFEKGRQVIRSRRAHVPEGGISQGTRDETSDKH